MGIASMKPDCDVIRVNPSSHTETFLVPATDGCCGIKSNFISSAADSKYQVSDIEMITFEASPYTSLKDLIQTSSPSSPSSWLIMSPNNGSRRDSWREIPIKDPLLQHAAWAYMLPMSADTEGPHTRNFMQKLKDQCCGVFGCLNDVVLVTIKNWASFSSR